MYMCIAVPCKAGLEVMACIFFHKKHNSSYDDLQVICIHLWQIWGHSTDSSLTFANAQLGAEYCCKTHCNFVTS